MMDFLRALAPPRQGDAQQAMPLLPSRFAAPRPISVVPAEDTTRDAPAAMDLTTPARSAAMPPFPGAPRLLSQQRSTPAPQAADETSTGKAQSAGTRDVTHWIAAVAVEPSLASRILSPDVEPDFQGSPSREPRSHRDIVREISTPLSAAAVAERSAVHPNPRTVIQVTIDRVEVRAPKAERPPASPAARRRAAASAGSLAEYLRRPRNPGGTR